MIKETFKDEMDGNIIFVGNKLLISYVLAVVTQFINYGSDEVVLKSKIWSNKQSS